MHKSIFLELRIKDEEIGCFNKERILCERKFDKSFGKYEVPPTIYGDGRAYFMEDSKIDIVDLKKQLDDLSPFYDVDYCESLAFSEEDYRKASGAMMDFPIMFEEYENYRDREALESTIELCETCKASQLKEKLFFRIEASYAQKLKTNFCGYASDSGAQIISIPLYDFLVRKGIDRKYFVPVYNLREQILGYSLNGSMNILPSGAVYQDDITYDVHKCSSCGRLSIMEEAFNDVPYRINKRSIAMLYPVNLTQEYWPFDQKLIISRELLFLMKEKWDNVLEFVKPVF